MNKRKYRKYITIIVLVVMFLAAFIPIRDYSVQIEYGNNYPRQPLFYVLLPKCGKGTVCQKFEPVWIFFNNLYN